MNYTTVFVRQQQPIILDASMFYEVVQQTIETNDKGARMTDVIVWMTRDLEDALHVLDQVVSEQANGVKPRRSPLATTKNVTFRTPPTMPIDHP